MSDEASYMKKEGIHRILIEDKDYPEALKNIYGPPSALYCKGQLSPVDDNAVAVIGSRRCSLYGLQMAEKLAYQLAENGITVVSGMARGIDSAAHRGALKAGGRTIAIMGSGFQNIYPPESVELMRTISQNGAVLTEYSSEVLPLKYNFPKRNRIISGMSKGVVVVEAARKSGAMITVNLALDEGKEVFAVPGRADLNTSTGTNLLIQKGAKLVTNVSDVLEELNICTPVQEMECDKIHHDQCSPSAVEQGEMLQLDKEHQEIVDILKKEKTVHVDRFFEKGSESFKKLPETLLRLEIKGLIKAAAGGMYTLK